jgi:hypothetical protein
MFDVECKYVEVEGETIAVCPACESQNIDLVSGDHGYECYDCAETFVCP